MSARDDAVAPLTDPDFVRGFQESAFGPDTPRPIIERAVEESMKLHDGDWKAALAVGMSAESCTAETPSSIDR